MGEPLGNEPDDRQDLEGGDDGRRRRQRADDLDRAWVEPDLLAGLAERALDEGFAGVGAAARERDLAAVPTEVAATLGEDQAGTVGPAVEGDEDGGAVAAVGVEALRLERVEKQPRERGAARIAGLAQMITCTVPPSTPQAAPST